jgi:hypothetical protein
MNICAASAGVFLLLLAVPAWACPDGFMPNAAGTPGVECIPIPGQTRPGNDDTDAPVPVWETRWGAIAYDPPSGSVGISSEQPSKRRAQKEAQQHCRSKGGSLCEIDITYHNQCVAVVSGPSPTGTGVLMNSASAATARIAEQLALETCVAGTRVQCSTFYTGCSHPVRVR